MPEPLSKPSAAKFIRFNPEELSKEVKLIHKLSHGNMDLQFSGMGGGFLNSRENSYLNLILIC